MSGLRRQVSALKVPVTVSSVWALRVKRQELMIVERLKLARSMERGSTAQH